MTPHMSTQATQEEVDPQMSPCYSKDGIFRIKPDLSHLAEAVAALCLSSLAEAVMSKEDTPRPDSATLGPSEINE